jgi:hypothetical protein
MRIVTFQKPIFKRLQCIALQNSEMLFIYTTAQFGAELQNVERSRLFGPKQKIAEN